MTICRVLGSRKGLVQVEVHDSGELCWTHLRRNNKEYYLSSKVKSIPAEDILHVRVMKKKTKQTTPEIPDAQVNVRSHVLLVRHVVRRPKKRLRLNTCVFFGTKEECAKLLSDLNRNREAVCGKPVTDAARKMLVLINPKSGRGSGLGLYYQRIKPLFTLCDITTQVIVSTHRGHLIDVTKNYDFTDIDGVVVIGGDGTYSEAMTGLVLRSMTEAKLDVNDVNCVVVPSSVPCGLITGGTGSWLASHIFGTNDPVTQTLHIIRGYKMPLGGLSVHCDERLVCFTFLLQHIGFCGDVIYQVNKNRWMGPNMYFVSSLMTLLRRRLMAATLKLYLADDSGHDKTSGDSTFIGTEVKVKAQAATPASSSTSQGEKQEVNKPTPPPASSSSCNDDHLKEVQNVEKAVKKTSMTMTSGNSTLGSSSIDTSANSTLGSSSIDTGQWHPEDNRMVNNLFTCEWTFGCQTDSEGLGVKRHQHHDFSDSWTQEKDLTPDTTASGSPFTKYPPNRKASPPQQKPQSTFSWDDSENTEVVSDVVFYNLYLDCSRTLTSKGNMKVNTNNDNMYLLLLKICSLPNFLNQLSMMKNNTPGMSDFPYVLSHQLRAMKLTLSSEAAFKKQTFYLNSDGETVPLLGDTYYFRFHPRILQVFGTPDS